MRKLSKEEILEIVQKIFSGSDIIAKHGTSITNALSILETGFNYDKTSMVGQKSKDPVKLCSYGWKESKRGVSYNGILLPGIEICHVPREFVKGCFVFCDNTNYMDFLSNQEEALEHLTYI